MHVLVLGATGATGKLVVKELIARGNKVKAIVRSLDRVDQELINSELVDLTVASILDLSEKQLLEHVSDCEAVISCLGHNLTLKGIFGHPRKLVTEATILICQAIASSKPLNPVKFVLMSTSGYQNLLRDETISRLHRFVVYILRKTLPPHVDNEEAAKYLQYKLSGSSIPVEWVVVRPDNLVNHDKKTDYEAYPSPICDPIFAALKTSRINVAHFMVELISSNEAWCFWKSDMPVVYNSQ